MLCRVAEDIFWMSRHVERAIAVGRLIDVTLHLELDDREVTEAHGGRWAYLLTPRADERADPLSLAEPGAGAADPRSVRYYLAFDVDNPRSLVSCVQRGRRAARRVRESISSDMWEALNALHLSLVDPAIARSAEDDPHVFYKRIREGAQFVQGLADATLARDEAWHFGRLGTYLERADTVAHMLGLQAHLLLGAGDEDHLVRWLAVLRSCGAAEAYARYYSLRVEPARVIEFLLLNSVFPQAVCFSLRTARSSLLALAADVLDGPTGASRQGVSPAVRGLGLLTAQLENVGVDEVLEGGLQPYLTDVQRQIAGVCDHITRVYLRDEPQPGRLVAVARAAMLMAAQQQQ